MQEVFAQNGIAGKGCKIMCQVCLNLNYAYHCGLCFDEDEAILHFVNGANA